MASTLPSSSRGYRPLSQPSSSGRAPLPMPGPLAKIAQAVRQNQILALQALQAAATASASSSSSSSSPPNSPPFAAASPSASGAATVAATQRRGRKFQAIRSPASSASSGGSSGSSSPGGKMSTARMVPLITTTMPYWGPDGSHPLIDPASGRRSEIYSLTNDRYPGAPGTALAKAREAQQKAIQNAKKEAAKKLASKAELEHLGVKGLGKKRKSSSPYASVNSGAHAGASGSTAIVASNSAASGALEKSSAAMSRESSSASRSGRTSRATNATASSSAVEPSSVPAATTSRARRPASRSNSPVPLTSHTGSSRRSSTRGASAAPTEDEPHQRSGGYMGTRSSPSRGNSPPDGTLKLSHSALSSTAPFQSSPLAAGSLTMEPALDTESAEADEKAEKKTQVGSNAFSPSTGRGASLKRKASTLSQEILVDADATDEAMPIHSQVQRDEATEPDSSKKVKVDAHGDKSKDKAERPKRKASPTSASTSRRTSPRTKNRPLAPAAKSPTVAAQDASGAQDSAEATKSRLSPLGLERAGAAADSTPQGSELRRGGRSRRGGAKSDLDAEEVGDENLDGSASK